MLPYLWMDPETLEVKITVWENKETDQWEMFPTPGATRYVGVVAKVEKEGEEPYD